jgi:hypothetical protein
MDATGAFTLTITNGAAPCVLQAVTPAVPGPTQTMYGVALAAGTVNITPLTQAVADAAVASAGSDIASAFANWGGTFTPSTLSASAISTAKAALLAYLADAGFTVAGVGDFMTESFPANSVHAHDKLLDEVVATKMPLTQLTAQAKTVVRLPDTGQTWCADANGTTIPCAGTGQDGELGLDSNSATNTALDGAAGFSYLKLGSTGKPLPASATSWDCVRDNITGLVWENKVAASNTAHLRSSAHQYTWYSTDSANNGGSSGSTGTNTCNATPTGSLCNTEAYVAAVNAAALCGKTDWRLPTREELRSIVNYGASNPAIDTNYFSNAQPDWHWSSSARASNFGSAWNVGFYSGVDNQGNRSNPAFVRLVRSSQ